jgi:hypothetical protein
MKDHMALLRRPQHLRRPPESAPPRSNLILRLGCVPIMLGFCCTTTAIQNS